MLKHFLGGFTVNLLTSIDDSVTRVPVLSSSARTTRGRLAFTLGNLLAVTVAIGIAWALAQVLTALPGGNTLIALLVFGLAALVYFDVLTLSPPKPLHAEIQRSTLSGVRTAKLVGLGFVMTFLMVLDDIFALAPLLVGGVRESLLVIAGIYAATLVLALGVLYFAEALAALPHQRLIATGTLVVFGVLLLVGVV